MNYQLIVQGLRLAFGDRPGLEDAVQDAFAKAYVRWSSVGSMSRPGTWVYVVSARSLRRSQRGDARRVNLIVEPAADVGFDQRSVDGSAWNGPWRTWRPGSEPPSSSAISVG
jgi:DNA-directed RNA polymerase specialized sigma24 family protein